MVVINYMDKLKGYDININGQGIIKDDKKLIYVDNLLPDEEAKIHLTSKKRGFYLGKVIDRYNDSINRINIECNICGIMVFVSFFYKVPFIHNDNRRFALLMYISCNTNILFTKFLR